MNSEREYKNPIPFLVVDRPMSLKLLKYCELDKQEGVYGLMGHANTSKNFQDLFRKFKGNNIIKAADFLKKRSILDVSICKETVDLI